MVAVGTTQYAIGTSPITGTGISYAATELDSALNGPVAAVVFDDEGTDDLSELLEGLTETEFEQQEIRRILNNNNRPESWRIGEALAETYLTRHKECRFPWPDGRDERKSGSSLPGADLVGFQQNEENDRFAFGEVKTSHERQYPPGTMYGRTGLKKQLEDLKDNIHIRDDLVKYLGHRASNSSWQQCYQNASKRYIQDNTDVSLFGVLVRDVDPNQDDLRVRITNLSQNCPAAMSIDLLALYLPHESIDALGEKIMESRQGGEA